MTLKNLDVSIILVSYNTCEYTRNCLKSIFEKTKNITFDVWVVDNNSIDNTCEVIKKEFPQVKLIENKENLGFGRANNIAIKQSNAKYIFLLNTDTILINNSAKILFDYMENNPNIGACGGNLYDENLKNVHSYGYFSSLKSECISLFNKKCIWVKNKSRYLDKGNNEKNEQKEVDIIIGADLFIRKSVIEEVGAFDEDFFLYDEESELQFRIKKAGYNIVINPESKIYHLEGKSTKSRITTRVHKMRSKTLFFKKCYSPKKLKLFKFIYTIGNVQRLIEHPIAISKAFKEIWKI